MTRRQGPPPAARRLATALLIACTAIAVANLPADDLPPGWLLAFLLPGAALGWLRDHLRRPWLRAVTAVVLQATACWLALVCTGPMTRPAALACTILPPLGFAAIRGQDADRALTLFLSFCVLLVGVILDGVHRPLLATYAVFACLSLRMTSHLAAHQAARPALHRGMPARTGAIAALGPIVLGCLLAALAVERALGLLPSPAGTQKRAAAAEDRTIRRPGLDDAFVLDGSRGVLSDLTGEQLVRVRSGEQDAVPHDLYLRSGFFNQAGLDSWRTGGLQLQPSSREDGHVLRPPLARLPRRWLEIERFAGARNFVFVPPGTFEIAGLMHLSVDLQQEWVRQAPGHQLSAYTVAFQDIGSTLGDPVPDPRARSLGLLSLPRELDRRRFEQLLADWQPGTEPLTAMARIAEHLAAHCRYDRIEPSGPFAHAIENFLFHTGDRRGYCMHFASAAALLLRLQGIPCRIGVGLYGGSPDPREPGARLYGSQHAHAWVEVPFAGRGYVVFDPTPPSDRGQRTPSRLDTSAQLDEDREQKTPSSAGNNVVSAVIAFLLQPWVLAALLVLALGSALLPGRAPAVAAVPAPVVDRTARRLLARLLQALSAAGHRRSRGATLESFAHELRRLGRLPDAVADGFLAYQEVRFGDQPLTTPRQQRLLAAIEATVALPPRQPESPAESPAATQPSAGQT